MKYFVICFTWLFFILQVNAQSITVTGKVMTEDRQPVPFASVVILKDTVTIAGKIADENGLFLLQIENADIYTIKITHAAYKELVQSIEINTKPEPLTLILKATGNALNAVTVTERFLYTTYDKGQYCNGPYCEY
jgi:iron complex outermembrane recepter protein